MSKAVSFHSLLVWVHLDERGGVGGDGGMKERRRGGCMCGGSDSKGGGVEVIG